MPIHRRDVPSRNDQVVRGDQGLNCLALSSWIRHNSSPCARARATALIATAKNVLVRSIPTHRSAPQKPFASIQSPVRSDGYVGATSMLASYIPSFLLTFQPCLPETPLDVIVRSRLKAMEFSLPKPLAFTPSWPAIRIRKYAALPLCFKAWTQPRQRSCYRNFLTKSRGTSSGH